MKPFSLSFAKMEALANDFVVCETLSRAHAFTEDRVRLLSSRKLGIGFDQLLVAAPPSGPHQDFDYHIYNADGSRVYQCGNGARAVAAYLWRKKLFAHRSLRFLVGERVLTAKPADSLETWADERLVEVDLGPFDAPKTLEIALDFVGRTEQKVSLSTLNIGNPHALLEESPESPLLSPMGEYLCGINSPLEKGVNLSFFEIQDKQHIRLATFERGVGLTSACGSAAAAAVATLFQLGRVGAEVVVLMKGGKAKVNLREGHIHQSGPVRHLYAGTLGRHFFHRNEGAP